MLRNYYINKRWIVSATARRVYRAAACLSLMLFAIMILANLGFGISQNILPFMRFLVLLGIFGTAMTLVAMEYYLFSFDKSSVWKKLFWFFVLLWPPIGPPIYCLVSYSRATAELEDMPTLNVGGA